MLYYIILYYIILYYIKLNFILHNAPVEGYRPHLPRRREIPISPKKNKPGTLFDDGFRAPPKVRWAAICPPNDSAVDMGL